MFFQRQLNYRCITVIASLIFYTMKSINIVSNGNYQPNPTLWRFSHTFIFIRVYLSTNLRNK